MEDAKGKVLGRIVDGVRDLARILPPLDDSDFPMLGLLDFDLADNGILGTHYRAPAAPSQWGVLDEAAITGKAKRLIHDFDVRPPDPSLPARALSGGNQQKLIIGREFDLQPKLLLVSQPTRGVDIGAIEFIHRKLIALRDAGAAILLALAITTLFMAIGVIGPLRTSMIDNSSPVWSILFAGILLGEMLSPLQLSGALLVIAAIVGNQVLHHRQARALAANP